MCPSTVGGACDRTVASSLCGLAVPFRFGLRTSRKIPFQGFAGRRRDNAFFALFYIHVFIHMNIVVYVSVPHGDLEFQGPL